MSEPQNTSAFNFEASSAQEPGVAQRIMPVMARDDQLRMAVEASGLATYLWNIETDEIVWSSNAGDVLGSDPRGFTNGRGFASYLDPDNFTSRYDTVMRNSQSDEGEGVAFQIEYKFRPEGRMGRASVWLEDHGRWFAGANGRPAEVFGTVRRIDDRHMRDQHLSFLGNCDPLTGMMNRGRMMEALGGAMTAAGRDGTHCAFIIAAINNLSVVNDAYGFEVADEVIINMGRRLRQVVRTGDAIARYSGSKFGIILNNCSEEDLAIAADRFLSVARESVIETELGPVWALLSIGALVLPQHAGDPSMAVARAEESLTEARRLPSDGFVIYKPSQQRLAARKLNAHSATEIVRCLREERFRLAFQPVVSAVDGVPAFHEALLRMTDQAGEVIAAGHLIPVAEKLGLVRLIDRAVVQMTVVELNKFPDAKLSFNISGTTATDPRWYPQIIEVLASNRGITDRLIIEITETVALGDMRETIRFVEQLRELGCGVAVDDFGAGYTSFRNLRAMPVDILKLDGTFCSNLSGDRHNQYFVRSLIDLARNFGIRTVAEWVETEADANLLRQWGVDLMQGNLFGEARLEPPWKEAPDAYGSKPEDAMPFFLPSEFDLFDKDEIHSHIPASHALNETAAGGDDTVSQPGHGFELVLQEVPAAQAETPELAEPDEPLLSAEPVTLEDKATPVEHMTTEEAGFSLAELPGAEPELQVFAPQVFTPQVFTPQDNEPQHSEPLDSGFAADVPADLEPAIAEVVIAELETAAVVEDKLPPPAGTMENFEESLSGELAKLRLAIAALDKAFKRPLAETAPHAEPSFADLVSDTVQRMAR